MYLTLAVLFGLYLLSRLVQVDARVRGHQVRTYRSRPSAERTAARGDGSCNCGSGKRAKGAPRE
jgi:hypothetical protein